MGAQPAGRVVRDAAMTIAQRLRRVVCVAAMMLGSASSWASTDETCEDFLSAPERKPPGLEYVGCAAGYEAQVSVLVASYKVRGSRADRVEGYLVQHTGMARLRFVCCGWEPAAVVVGGVLRREGRLPRGQEPSDGVTMFSDETGVSRRADWAQIPAFHVRVTRYLESP